MRPALVVRAIALVAVASSPAGAFMTPTPTTTTTTKRSTTTLQAQGDQQTRKSFLGAGLTGLLVLGGMAQQVRASTEGTNLSDIVVKKESKDVRIGDVLGKANIIVNVASQCALTGGSYTGLVDLYKRYHDKGLEILAFPSNQFGYQEPDPVEKIRVDIKNRFGVTFPIFDKIDVNGANASPLYKAIKTYEPELSGYSEKIAWNFEKFLVSQDGRVLRRYRPGVDPLELEPDLESLLAKGTIPPARKRSLNEF